MFIQFIYNRIYIIHICSMWWCRSKSMPDNFWKGKGQGVLYLHGKKSAQKLRGKHIFLEHDIDDKTIRYATTTMMIRCDGAEVRACLIISATEKIKVHFICMVKNQHRNYEENTSFSNTTFYVTRRRQR